MSLVSERTRRLVEEDLCGAHELENPCPECAREQQESDRAQHEARIARRVGRIEPILEACGVGKRYLSCSFENFKGEDEEAEAISQTLLDYAMNDTSVVLQGGTGCGKTHLAIAMLRELVKALKVNERDDAQVITAPELLLEIRSSFRENSSMSEEYLVEKYASLPYLILDDIGAEKSSEFSIATLYVIIDRRSRENLPTIYTTNLGQEQIRHHLGERIASRLADAVQIELNFSDYRRSRQ